MKIKSAIPHILLPDRLLGHLLSIYLRLYKKSNGKYYLTISLSDPIWEGLEKWGLVGLFDKGYGLSRETKFLIYKYERMDHMLRIGAMHPGVSSQSPSKRNKTQLQFIQALLKKYKPYKSFISDYDLKKIKDNQEVYDTLTQIITINAQQFNSLSSFIKKYYELYAKKELDGQQYYMLPSNYAEAILTNFNNPGYIKAFGCNNLTIKSGNSPNFCHTLMYLIFQENIRLRKIVMWSNKVDAIIDNLSGNVSQPEETVQPDVASANQVDANQGFGLMNKDIEWPDEFQWSTEHNAYLLGDGKQFTFGAKNSFRKNIFTALVDKKGEWATVNTIASDISKSEGYVRTVINQLIKRAREASLQKYLLIESRDMANKPGAYRIIPFPQGIKSHKV